MASKSFKLDTEDFKSIVKGFFIGLTGAILTYITEYLGNIDFKEYTPLMVALLSTLINILRKWIKDNSK